MIAKIAVSAAAFAIDKPYSYYIPDGMVLQPGIRVTVPFGRGNRRCEGVVLALESGDEAGLKAVEQILDEATGIIAAMEEAFQNYQSIQPQLDELFAYYFSPQWKQDLDDDCAGKLPVHLKRGVLSEDAVYNLLTDNMCLIESLQKQFK